MPRKSLDPWAAARGFTDREWTLFQTRITHARKAIDTLRERAPEVFKHVFGHSPYKAHTHQLSKEAQAWIDTIVGGLLDVQRTRPRPHRPKPAKATLAPPRLHLVRRTGKKKR